MGGVEVGFGLIVEAAAQPQVQLLSLGIVLAVGVELLLSRPVFQGLGFRVQGLRV